MAIAQSNPALTYLAQKEEIDAATARVLASGRYILGGEVEAFEREFAAYNHASHAIGAGNGTDALHLALRAAGVEPGDVVVTVANTAVATAAAIEMAGARIAFVDVDSDTLTMNPAALAGMLERGAQRFRAVIPVHLFGRCAAIEEIVAVAARQGLTVIEDCAQAHGASTNGATAGTFGAAAAFSFYPTKNLGAIGDGGAVVTSDDQIAEQARALRQYGWRERDLSLVAGVNSRLDEIQAAILRVKLLRLDADNQRRRLLAARYDRELAGAVQTPAPDEGAVHHQYVVRTPRRDSLRQFLSGNGIASLVHYPTPIHLQPAYRGRVVLPEDGLPVTEHAAAEILSLPMHAHLTDEEQSRVCDCVRQWAIHA
ncbi:MAG TPA: DegT/DnrJ/EryC1/StrS family aminotransferase [Thermoanaerobaculia bacterium]|nr:DegT/DnrJ/EryC1/StrS family aminotransferase [Thermoanaerobaculia bacterium]